MYLVRCSVCGELIRGSSTEPTQEILTTLATQHLLAVEQFKLEHRP